VSDVGTPCAAAACTVASAAASVLAAGARTARGVRTWVTEQRQQQQQALPLMSPPPSASQLTDAWRAGDMAVSEPLQPRDQGRVVDLMVRGRQCLDLQF
jgi:hypothetical protein